MDAYPNTTHVHPTDEMDMVIDAQTRKSSVAPDEKLVVQERVWGLAARIDETVTFEEYTFWAKIEREMEREDEIKYQAEYGNYPLLKSIKANFTSEGRARQKREKAERAMALQSSIEATVVPVVGEKQSVGEVTTQPSEATYSNDLRATDAEWRTAARAMKTASWGQMFFLITTDILGWSGAP